MLKDKINFDLKKKKKKKKLLNFSNSAALQYKNDKNFFQFVQLQSWFWNSCRMAL